MWNEGKIIFNRVRFSYLIFQVKIKIELKKCPKIRYQIICKTAFLTILATKTAWPSIFRHLSTRENQLKICLWILPKIYFKDQINYFGRLIASIFKSKNKRNRNVVPIWYSKKWWKNKIKVIIIIWWRVLVIIMKNNQLSSL